LFVKRKKNSCVLLLDDLSAELDTENFSNVLDVIVDLGLQSFITSIEPIQKLSQGRIPHKLFHVKHGLVKEVI